MKFKELFGSFTGHRIENRSTGMRYGSTGSVGAKKQEACKQEPVADGLGPVGDAFWKYPSPLKVRIQSFRPSAPLAELGTRRRWGHACRRRAAENANVNLSFLGIRINSYWWLAIHYGSYILFGV
ncbi:hypothetical protein HanPI659440_Chr15g0577921 [Helianthus annuus]|nr:hypothetical protein HanPI659440_Chr15g0577921 [Helianthus annuus]